MAAALSPVTPIPPPDTLSYGINALVSFGVVAAGALLLVLHWLFRCVPFLDVTRHKATSWAFVAWLSAWVCLAVTHGLLRVHASDSAILMMSNVADVANLIFVIAYATGNDLALRRLIAPAIAGTVLPGVYYAGLYYLFSVWPMALPPLEKQLVFISPSIVLASVTTLLVGWTFIVRWGVVALPLFAVAGIYSWAQVPAYLAAFVHNGRLASERPELNGVLWFLVWGKALMATYGFGLFLCTGVDYPEMSGQQFFPSRSGGVVFDLRDSRIRRGIGWVVTNTIAAVIGAAVAILMKQN